MYNNIGDHVIAVQSNSTHPTKVGVSFQSILYVSSYVYTIVLLYVYFYVYSIVMFLYIDLYLYMYIIMYIRLKGTKV